MRVATVDIGTNTVLLLIAERVGTEVAAVDERATITRLGEGVDRTRALGPQAIERTMACLSSYAALIRASEAARVAVVATSAMRDASGGEPLFRHIRTLLGVDLEVITGEEEARLTFAGALSGLDYDEDSGEVVVFDVGGGSTEVVMGRVANGRRETVRFARSYDVGSVRLTERHVASDPPGAQERETILRTARDALRGIPLSQGSSVPVGIAGTITTLAAISLGLSTYDSARIHGLTLEVSEVQRVVDALSAVSLDQRSRTPGLDPKRADVIIAGGLVVLAVLKELNATAVRVSDRGVRWGLALRLLAS